jgi:hypothetical protein
LFVLALVTQKYLEHPSCQAGVVLEWKSLLRGLDRLRIRHRGNDWLVRTDLAKPIADLFRYTHIAMPPRAKKQMAPPRLEPPTKSDRERRSSPPGVAPRHRQFRRKPP